jgi:uncharacterized protein (TIGR00159 family)
MEIGFITISIWDVLDIVIVGFLLYQVYRLLKGSVAFNIFIGVVLLYLLWWGVDALNMRLLSLILGQFVSIGVILLIIIFQPEVRKFLLYLGNTTLKSRLRFFNRFVSKQDMQDQLKEEYAGEIVRALNRLSVVKLGALIVVSESSSMEFSAESGIEIDAHLTAGLLESIFQKESPLHDGAVFISNGRIHRARCILPVSQNEEIPPQLGLRHRAAIGVTENSSALALVASEENGSLSYVTKGELHYQVGADELRQVLLNTL